MKIWRNASGYDPAKAAPMTWMAAIARNRALDEARKRKHATLDPGSEDLHIAAPETDPLAGRQKE